MGSDTAIDETLLSHGYTLSLHGYSALDRYWGLPELPVVWAETSADIPGLAKLFDAFRFPGVELADGAVDYRGQQWYFRCLDPDETPEPPSYKLLSLTQDCATRRFRDPGGIYPLIRELRGPPYLRLDKHDPEPPDSQQPWWAGLNPAAGRYRAVMDASLILARYGTAGDHGRAIPKIAKTLQGLTADLPPQAESRRVLLASLMVSPRPDLGMELLKAAGFVAEFWPELAQLDDVDHSKEFHPEGNVWQHTLETFRYRKTPDLVLSLGLLLHDVGKPLSASSGTRRFDGHAELGARAARKFLESLEFEPRLIADVYYLVKNHMLPAALPRLPLTRTGAILESPLFPTLLELYRCDESSSFKGLDGYYESSAAYQAYLRRLRNPYRSADGKKLGIAGR
jgi:poly(A) polymerase